MAKIEASVIIPTHNRAYVLKQCLKYLANQTTKAYEIIVIDDASEDETPELNSKFQIPNFKFIRLEKQVGPYVARNIGIREAKGKIIIFIDSDVLVHPQFVEDHIKIHQQHKKVFVQGMVRHIRNTGQTPRRWWGYYPNALCIGTFITQNVSVCKEWLDKVGGFDEFGGKIGFKDVDLGLRLRKIGLRGIHTLFKCKAYHIDELPSKGSLKEFFLKHQERGRSAVFFINRHGKLGERFAHIRKALFISKFFQTDTWVEKGLGFLESTRDSPILPLFPLCKAIMKYHYRAKGILDAGFLDSKDKIQDNSIQHPVSIIQYPIKASVIVVSYNRKEILKYCLKALLSQTINEYEIIVVDDGSTDGTPELITEIQDAKLKYIKNPVRMGQPYARNLGIKEAKAEIIIFVDSDVIVAPNFVEDHIKLHTQNNFIVQGMVRHIKKPQDAGKLSLLIDGLCLTGLITQNVSLRKEWLLQVGGFDESFGKTMGYMDVDIGMRLKKLGLCTLYAFRKCKAWHVDTPPTETKLRNIFQKTYERARNAMLLAQKYGKWVENRFPKPTKVILVSKFFNTFKWAEKEKNLRFLIRLYDLPILPLFPMIKEIMKYHYRAKGVLEVQNPKLKTQNSKLTTHNPRPRSHDSRVLFLSNCYGEDRSAAIIGSELKKLMPAVEIIGVPLISYGEEYERRGISVLIKNKIPPSGGFPRSLIELLKDALSLYIPIKYYLALKKMRGKICNVVVVGDVFLLVLGWLALYKKIIFIASAKSNYQNPHYKIEELLMRKLATQVFTHDELTAENLRKTGVPALFLGNPMVDGLTKTQTSKNLIGILPGSRDEAYKNFLKILLVVEQLSSLRDNLKFASAISATIDLQRLLDGALLKGWQYRKPELQKGKTKVLVLQDAFVDVISQSDVIIGLAGTANEQAAALGKPIVSFVGCGPQTSRKRMKNQEKLLGGCLKFVQDFPQGVVAEIIGLLDDEKLRQNRGKIGIERMGPPGGAKNIAEFISRGCKPQDPYGQEVSPCLK